MSTFRLLVLDDEPEILEVIQNMLKFTKGIEVLRAETVEQGIQLLPMVDGVLADCVVPDISEFEEAVVKVGRPMIRMSGKIDRAVNLEIPKPFTGRQLLDAIDMLKFFYAPSRDKKKVA